jgi:16S rRNA processing protein RimM
MASLSKQAKPLCVGVVTGAHGIKGEVRVKSFTENPLDVAAYGPVADETGARRFALSARGQVKGTVIVGIEGVVDRDAAEALKGTRFYVERAQLPPVEAEDEFYHADLIGLSVRLIDGALFGTVTAVSDFGAGVSLEISTAALGTVMVPFTRAAVPLVDLNAGSITLDPPAGLFDKPDPPADLNAQAALAAALLRDGEAAR